MLSHAAHHTPTSDSAPSSMPPTTNSPSAVDKSAMSQAKQLARALGGNDTDKVANRIEAELERMGLDAAIDSETARINAAAKLIGITRTTIIGVCSQMMTELDSGAFGGDLIDWLRGEVGKVLIGDADRCAAWISQTFPSLAARNLRYQDNAGWQFAITRYIHAINDNCPDCGGRILGNGVTGKQCTDCDHETSPDE